MIAAIVIINIIVLLGAIYLLTKQFLQGLTAPIQLFASVIILIVALSFIYYLSLILELNFNILAGFFTAINLAHLYFTAPRFKNLLLSTKTATVKYDIVPVSAVFIMAVFFVANGSKYGFFDGWALWTSHAKFLYHPDAWTHMFADTTYESSADYPLMLPALIAFFWRTVNSISFVVPILISFSFLAALPVLLYYALKAEFKNNVLAIMAMALLVMDHAFLAFASEQCADIPLSVFILMVFIIYNYLQKSKAGSAAYVLGFICASCTWVKNEGQLFYMLFSAGFIICHYKTPGYLKRYFIGSLLPLAVTLSFKQLYAPHTAFFASGHNSIQMVIGKLHDISRYVLVGKSFAQLLVDGFWIALIFLFVTALVNRRYFGSFGFIVLFLMFAGYTFVYLISPYNLGWHIFTSFHRLINQIYPSLIFTSLVSMGYRYPRLACRNCEQIMD